MIVLHYGGHPCAMGEVLALASDRDVAVVEDAAHAPGAILEGRPCGSMGVVGCFSFFSNKNLPVGEGGMLVTDDAAVAERFRLLRSHGMTTLTWDRHRGHAGDPTTSSRTASTTGWTRSAPRWRSSSSGGSRRRMRRGAHRRRYREGLDGVEGISPCRSDGKPRRASSSHHLAVVLLPPNVARGEVREALAARRIQTSVHYPPIHSFTAFRELSRRPLPRTDAVAARILTLPLYPHVTDEQVELVAEELVSAVCASRPRARAAR